MVINCDVGFVNDLIMNMLGSSINCFTPVADHRTEHLFVKHASHTDCASDFQLKFMVCPCYCLNLCKALLPCFFLYALLDGVYQSALVSDMLLPVIEQIPQIKLETISTISRLDHLSDFVSNLDFP